jgi:hypothetical protein
MTGREYHSAAQCIVMRNAVTPFAPQRALNHRFFIKLAADAPLC